MNLSTALILMTHAWMVQVAAFRMSWGVGWILMVGVTFLTLLYGGLVYKAMSK